MEVNFLIFSKKFYSENKELAEKLWKRIGEIRDKQTQILIKKYPEK